MRRSVGRARKIGPVRREARRRRAWIAGGGLAFILGCSSSPPPPIPDPGGPFHTDVSPGATLGALAADQAEALCVQLAVANQSYLRAAVESEAACRGGAVGITTAAARQQELLDGGVDAGGLLSVCQKTYDGCRRDLSSPCIVPAPGCAATVELLSACLNEIANSDPLAKCVTTPTCGEAADAGWTPAAGAGPCGAAPNAPSLPACARLFSQCPDLALLDPY